MNWKKMQKEYHTLSVNWINFPSVLSIPLLSHTQVHSFTLGKNCHFKENPSILHQPLQNSCLRDSFLLLNLHCVLYKTIVIRPMLQKFTTHWHSLLHSIKELNWCICAIPKTSALLINPKTIFIPTHHLLLCCDLIFWQLKVFSGKLDTDLVRISSSLP